MNYLPNIRIMLLVAIGFLWQSCSEEYINTVKLGKPVKLSAACIPTIKTRADVDLQSNAFDDGEVINVYITANDDRQTPIGGNPITECLVVNNGTSINDLIPSPQPYFPESGTVNILGLYPISVKNTDSAFKVQPTQKTDTEYKNSDLMYARVNNQIMTDRTVLLQFAHKMAKIIINATGEEGVEITGVRLTNVCRSIPFNTEDGTVTLGMATDMGDIEMTNGGAALIPPQTISKNVNGNFIEISTNFNVSAYFDIDNKNFEEGKEYTANITIGRQSLGLTAHITDWVRDDGSMSIVPPSASDLQVTGIENAVYSPEFKITPYEPTPVIKDTSKDPVYTLIKDTDYEVQYFGNDRAGTGTIVIIGLGDPTGYGNLALVRSFTIRKAEGALKFYKTADDTQTAISSATASFDYGKSVTSIGFLKTGDGSVTVSSSDPTVASVNYNNDTDVLTITMLKVGSTTITASMADDNNYTAATTSLELEITKKEASSLNISLEKDRYVYDGTAHRPHVTVMDGDNQLTEDTHYTVSYSNNINHGVATVSVTGIGTYTGTTPLNYTIDQASNSITINNVTISDDETPESKNAKQTSLALTMAVDGAVDRWAEATWGNVSYSSSNSSAVSVSPTGVLTALKATGNTPVIITVTVPEESVYGNYKGVSLQYSVSVKESVFNFPYTSENKPYEWTCDVSGNYLLEVWGAEGGAVNRFYTGGRGAYIAGAVWIDAGQKLYVYVGGQGGTSGVGGWNGGGSCTNGTPHSDCTGGGGSTDISLKNAAWNSADHLNNRIIVAGGGGGALYVNTGNGWTSLLSNGGYGGAWDGRAGTGMFGYAGGGGTRNSGGKAGGTNASAGTFGRGGDYSGTAVIGCGGGGWYGGGAGGDNGNHGAGGGGSSIIWNSNNASYYNHLSSKPDTKWYLKERNKKGANNSGNGRAKITLISTD